MQTPDDKLFADARKSAWMPEEFRGPVPEPAEDIEAQLERMQALLLRVSAEGADADVVSSLARLLNAVAVIPPEDAFLADFANDVCNALMDLDLDAPAARRLTQLIYVALNSAALGRAELRGLQGAVSSLLEGAGADNNRIQTLVFNIATLNELIKGGRG